MRLYTPADLPKLNRIDGGENGRRYQTPEGNLYPSVTTIFSIIKNEFLDEWRARVGEEEAKKIAARAAARGTYIHEQCEYLLKNQNPPKNHLAKMLYNDNWRKFKPLVDQIGDVFALEAPLYSNYLKVAGTVDCVGMWKDKLSIIDFKTSSRMKSHEDIESYWMQCAAYAVMWEERTGQPINNLVILMSVDDEEPLVFEDRRNNWINKFIDLRKVYAKTVGD